MDNLLRKQHVEGVPIYCLFNLKDEEVELDDLLIEWTFLEASGTPANRANILNIVFSFSSVFLPTIICEHF